MTIEHFYAQSACIRLRIHKIHHCTQRTLSDKGIGIEQEYVLPLTETDSLIVGARETYILLVSYKMNFGETTLKILYRTISRIIVYDPYLRINPLGRLSHGEKALFQEIRNTIIDNNDG